MRIFQAYFKPYKMIKSCYCYTFIKNFYEPNDRMHGVKNDYNSTIHSIWTIDCRRSIAHKINPKTCYKYTFWEIKKPIAPKNNRLFIEVIYGIKYAHGLTICRKERQIGKLCLLERSSFGRHFYERMSGTCWII